MSRAEARALSHRGAQIFDAVVLAGGRSRRLGSPKALLRKGRQTLIENALSTVAGARRIVVVGPAHLSLPDAVQHCREIPPFSGPAAALAAGLGRLAPCSPWILVLACDVPGARSAVERLLAAAAADVDADGLLALPSGDRPQPLVALYRSERLRAVFESYDPTNRSMRSVIERLRTENIAVAADSCRDIDTPAHARALGWSPVLGAPAARPSPESESPCPKS